MTTLYFTQHFTKGLLKGIYYHSSITFVSVERAMVWVKAIKASRRLNYTLTDYAFQNYQR